MADMKPELVGAFPWESETPLHVCRGFLAAASNLRLELGYAVYGNGAVFLFALESVGGQSFNLWRKFWTTRESAIRAAENLCADVEDYLDSVYRRRPSEDTGMDDYIEHMKARLNNELH